MQSISHLRSWNQDHITICPGGVSSVGQTCVQQRYKRSSPDQRWVLDARVPCGSNTVDGNNISMYNISAGARVFDRSWQNPGWRTKCGEIIQDLRAVDRLTMPLMGSAPQWDWQNKLAQAYKVQGARFATNPGGFQAKPGSIPNGIGPRAEIIGTNPALQYAPPKPYGNTPGGLAV
jgi:hypothetical protein